MARQTLEHTIEGDSRIVVIGGPSAPPLEAARESLTQLAADPRLRQGFGVLILVSPDAPPPSGIDILRMAGILTSLTQTVAGPVAIVVQGEEQAVPARMMALAGDRPYRVECFSAEHEARLWLRTQLNA